MAMPEHLRTHQGRARLHRSWNTTTAADIWASLKANALSDVKSVDCQIAGRGRVAVTVYVRPWHDLDAVAAAMRQANVVDIDNDGLRTVTGYRDFSV